MRDVFTIIAERVLNECGDDPICTHVGNIQACTVRSHPTYQALRGKARLGRSKSVASMRLWESIGTLARESEPEEREKWLTIMLDLLTPNFGGWSRELAQQWQYDLSDIRSAMVEGALDAWFSAGSGAPATKLLETMKARAYGRARSLVEAGRSETSSGSADEFISNIAHENNSTLHATSIVDTGTVHDPDADERIRGERFGSLLQRMGAMSYAAALHQKIRSGCRSEADAPTITPAQVGRSWVDGKNLYYRPSDLMPQYTSFGKAAKALGVSESQATKMAKNGALPVSMVWIGNSRAVSLNSLMHVVGFPDSLVHPDDVENGASHIGEK
ncbi:hypothetical protein [Streptomyces sp. LKA04]|uniref:hypothetical protein n=1 Tax=Streptomyces sp. LKA04 TaxID=3398092 RepID=UPI003A8128C6